ncbi:MAG: IS3 family transposase [Mycoplasmatales bacterium]|nr:IS3 family transposase [Mycoplasmatales bacterium]
MKKIFKPRIHELKIIRKALNAHKEKGLAYAVSVTGLSKSTISKYVAKEKEGFEFTDPIAKTIKRVYSKSKSSYKTNSKFSYEFKKIVIHDYKKLGYKKCLDKYPNLSSSTLLRWQKQEKKGALKPKKNTRNNGRIGLSVIGRYTRSTLINKNKLESFETSSLLIKQLSNIGKYKYIESMNEEGLLPISFLCEVAGVTRQAYYKWKRSGKPEIPTHNKALANFISNIKTTNKHWGSRTIKWKYEDATGERVSRSQVMRVMELVNYHSTSGKHRKRYSRPSSESRKNLLKTNYFNFVMENSLRATRSNAVWFTDAHFIFPHTDRRGKLKLITLLDSHDKSVVSFTFTNSSDHTYIFIKLLEETFSKLGKPLVIHSDNGYEFTNHNVMDFYKRHKIKASFSKPGKPQENGVIERFHKTLKIENNLYKDFKNIQDAKNKIIEYIDYYNLQRRHSTLKYETPGKIRKKSLEKTRKHSYEGILELIKEYKR